MTGDNEKKKNIRTTALNGINSQVIAMTNDCVIGNYYTSSNHILIYAYKTIKPLPYIKKHSSILNIHIIIIQSLTNWRKNINNCFRGFLT